MFEKFLFVAAFSFHWNATKPQEVKDNEIPHDPFES